MPNTDFLPETMEADEQAEHSDHSRHLTVGDLVVGTLDTRQKLLQVMG